MPAPASARPGRPQPLRAVPGATPGRLPGARQSALPSALPRPLLRSVLGDVLRRTRRRQHRTLADVAAAARVSVPYLSEVERGRKEVSSEVLAAICDDGLRVRLSDVLAEIGRELAADQERRARVERIEAIRARHAIAAPAPSSTSRARGAGDVVCLAA
jgi:transcriptional regulator with XRE-family HTH domain